MLIRRLMAVVAVGVIAGAVAFAAPLGPGAASGSGTITVKPEPRSAPECKAAADKGDVKAMLEMALRSDTGVGGKKDPADAIAWLTKAADKGSADAQCVLGYRLLTGTTIAKDEQKGAELLTRAAEQGHAAAQFELGMAYMNAAGVARTETKGHELLLAAAQQGHLPAQGEAGYDYLIGRGTTVELPDALTWLQKAADANNAIAQRHLAGMHRDGKGVPKDLKQAFNWYLRSATAGDEESMWEVAQMYNMGDGAPRDPDRSILWFKRLAEQDHLQAQYELGRVSPQTYQQIARPLGYRGSEMTSRPNSPVQIDGRIVEAGRGKWTLTTGGRATAERRVFVDAHRITETRAEKGHNIRVFGVLQEDGSIEAVTHILPPAAYKYTYKVKTEGAMVAGNYTSFSVTGVVSNTGPQPIKQLALDIRLFQTANGEQSTQPLTLANLAPGESRNYSIRFQHYTWYSKGNNMPKAEITEKKLDW